MRYIKTYEFWSTWSDIISVTPKEKKSKRKIIFHNKTKKISNLNISKEAKDLAQKLINFTFYNSNVNVEVRFYTLDPVLVKNTDLETISINTQNETLFHNYKSFIHITSYKEHYVKIRIHYQNNDVKDIVEYFKYIFSNYKTEGSRYKHLFKDTITYSIPTNEVNKVIDDINKRDFEEFKNISKYNL